MLLADRIAQCRAPFVVCSRSTGAIDWLSGAAEAAGALRECACRYVLSDELVRLCTELAYSSPERGLALDERLHVPAERVWVEWCEAPWRSELTRAGFGTGHETQPLGRRGALVRAARDGRSGTVRTFWSAEPERSGGANAEADVLASSMEAYFDFDAERDREPVPPDGAQRAAVALRLGPDARQDALHRCVRVRYEQSWETYYARAALAPSQRGGVLRHALGTIALDIPVLFTFFLLLGTRVGLPQRPISRGRLNRSRTAEGRPLLLDHVEVCCPIIPAPADSSPGGVGRRTPRLHHVRGHLVRRAGRVFWRLPHLRGNARAGVVRTRTVTWTVEPAGPHAP